MRGRFFSEYPISFSYGLISGFSVAQGEYSILKQHPQHIDSKLLEFTSTVTLLATMGISMTGHHVREGDKIGHAFASYAGYLTGYLVGMSLMHGLDRHDSSIKLASRRP